MKGFSVTIFVAARQRLRAVAEASSAPDSLFHERTSRIAWSGAWSFFARWPNAPVDGTQARRGYEAGLSLIGQSRELCPSGAVLPRELGWRVPGESIPLAFA
jgi:hypothetical protein